VVVVKNPSWKLLKVSLVVIIKTSFTTIILDYYVECSDSAEHFLVFKLQSSESESIMEV